MPNLNQSLTQKKGKHLPKNNNNPNEIGFTVGAGIINRLGKELVGRAETAVSELIKNAYDADAQKVTVEFINTDQKGGTLIITDDGHGMNRIQLKNGFMRIASTDKIENPISPKYKRQRAGRKGIGRFATQFLGEKLRIITQTEVGKEALQLVINWNKYETDKNVVEIVHLIKKVEKAQVQGTTLIIEPLRDKWNKTKIKRVFRYISDLLQPEILAEYEQPIKNVVEENFFDVCFYKMTTENKQITKEDIVNTDTAILKKAVAVMEGYVNKNKEAFYSVTSDRFNINESLLSIPANAEQYPYSFLSEVSFKAYYYIHNRNDYYVDTLQVETTQIKKLLQKIGGIRIYKNGFRVFPYGEKTYDWLSLDSKNRGRSGTNVPYANKNVYGFIQIKDPKDQLFQEKTSREGFIENTAFEELKDFTFKVLKEGIRQVSIAIEKEKEEAKQKRRAAVKLQTTNEVLLTINTEVQDFIQEFKESGAWTALNEQEKKVLEQKSKDFQQTIANTTTFLEAEHKDSIEELGMLRVLAGLGLIIGEFTHEVRQFTPAFNGLLSVLYRQKLDEQGMNCLKALEHTFNSFTSYTSLFDHSVSRNVSRKLEPINLIKVIRQFLMMVKPDTKKAKITFVEPEFYNFDLYTIPMHPSEWTSILFNLYTNAKKAIKKRRKKENINGKIFILAGVAKHKNKEVVYLEFLDNGIGIPEAMKAHIFDPFVTNSTPVGYHATKEEELVGTGLGLKIVKDIAECYQGRIFVVEAAENYRTAFRIEIPKNKDQ